MIKCVRWTLFNVYKNINVEKSRLLVFSNELRAVLSSTLTDLLLTFSSNMSHGVLTDDAQMRLDAA